MKEHPILFSGEMVRAILDGSKTQTRTVINPHGHPGDRLWVREAWGPYHSESEIRYFADDKVGRFLCQSEWFDNDWRKNRNTRPSRPSIHMNRWMSRINLEVTDVRVESVQDISHKDAIAEGVKSTDDYHELVELNCEVGFGATGHIPLQVFEYLWNNINRGKEKSWDANPLVWVVTFKPFREGN